MNKRKILHFLFSLNVLILILLVVYKIYLNFFEQDFQAVHAEQVERIEAELLTRTSYSFAVVGNINNSIGIFERKIIPMLNRSGIDFMISTGNAVSSGGEDKYRALYRALDRLDKPYVLTFGQKEDTRLGGFRFYNHFGPYVFAFSAGTTRFVFLDGTGTTSFAWQLRWLEEELIAPPDEQHTFVFCGRPARPVDRTGLLGFDDDYILPETFRRPLCRIMEQAVLAGAGIGFFGAREAAAHPDLVQVMPPQEDWTSPLWLVTHVDLHRTAKVQAFLSFLKEYAGEGSAR